MMQARETVQQTEACRAKNMCLMANSRSAVKPADPINRIIEKFLGKGRVGPEYVYTSCHRMMYKHSVVIFRSFKYTKTIRAIRAIRAIINLSY